MLDSDSDSDDSVFNQPLPFARQSQSLTSVGDDDEAGDGGGGDNGGNGSTSLSQPMADAAVGSGGGSGGSDNNGGDTTDCSPTPKKRKGGDDNDDDEEREERVTRRANARLKHTVLADTDKRAITSPSQLFWCIANKKGGKGKLYYACRVVDNPDQYKGLELPNLKEGEVCVQYFDYAGAACSLKNYGNVRRSKLVPFHNYGSADGAGDAAAGVDLTTASWCPDLCALYETQLRKELKSRIADAEERAIQIRVHLLFLPMALEHARAQEAEIKLMTASQKKNVKRSRPTGCMSSNDIDAALADNEATDENDASSGEDDNDDDDNDSLDPANKKRKTEILRPGDVIEFYHIMAVHGRKEDLRQAKIISVDPKEVAVLIMDNGDCLPKDHQIKRIKKIHRGKLIDCENANFQQVDYFRLSKATLKGTDAKKIHGAANAKEASRVAEIIKRNMTQLQEKAQADGFAPMDLMNKYKGGTSSSTDRTKVDLSGDIEAVSSKQRELQQTIDGATDAAAPCGATEVDDRKPSAATSETQRNDDDDDGEKKTEEWAEL